MENLLSTLLKNSRAKRIKPGVDLRRSLKVALATGRWDQVGQTEVALNGETRSCQTSGSLWSITAKNTDCSTRPLARPFPRSLAPLTRSLAPDCSLRSCPPLCSLVRSLTHFAHSLASGTVNDWMAILSVFFSIFDHSGL